MANSAYGSGLNLDALMVPVQAATVFAAQEQSLYLPGTLVPMVDVPAGSSSAQVAVMGSVDAANTNCRRSPFSRSSSNPGAQDFDSVLPTRHKENNQPRLDC